MITNWLRSRFSKDDNGVSPVVGTILMVAATVAIGATVFAALNAFGSESVEAPTNAVWTAKAVDVDKDGSTDGIRLTYVSGPAGLDVSAVGVKFSHDAAVAALEMSVDGRQAATTWSPGDFAIYQDGDMAVAPGTAGTYYLTLTLQGSTILDQTFTLDE